MPLPRADTFRTPGTPGTPDSGLEPLDDPSHDYARMDAASQALYHEAIAAIAARLRCPPGAVAAEATRLAKAQCAVTRPGDATRHVGYFLVAEGRDTLYASLASHGSHASHASRPSLASETPDRSNAPAAASGRSARRRIGRLPRERWTIGPCLAAIAIVSLLLTVATAYYLQLSDLPLLAAIPVVCLLLLQSASRSTLFAVELGTLARPRLLPRLDFSAGIPADCLTAVCVPTLLTDRRDVANTVAIVERHWATFGGSHIRIVLLTDWPDADQPGPTPDEAAALDELAAEIDRLNASYGRDGIEPVCLLHRARRYSEGEQCWMGWERKRGKLLQFNRLVAEGTHDFARTVGDLSDLRRAVYALSVDDDTVLAPDALHILVGTIAHPVARLQRDTGRGGAVRGFGAMVPELRRRHTLDTEQRRRPTDDWARKPDFDLFAQCNFQGQGLYDIRWAHRQLERRFPEGTVLSHDIIEGGFLRCGFAERALLIERRPQTYGLFNARWHRWMRGDWQNLWMMTRLHRDALTAADRPTVIQWYWVLLNIMLSIPSLTLAPLLAVVVFGDPARADRRLAILLGVNLAPDVAAGALRLYASARRVGRRLPTLYDIMIETLSIPYAAIELVASSLHCAFVSIDAVVTVIVRIIRRRHLLAWVSSSQLTRRGRPFDRLDAYYNLAPVLALLSAVWLWRTERTSLSALGVLVLMMLWPVPRWVVQRRRAGRQ